MTGSSGCDTIVLMDDVRDGDDGVAEYLDIRLAGDTKTVEAGEFTLPYMHLSGNHGSVVINGGVYAEDSFAAMPDSPSTSPHGNLEVLSRYFVRIYGKTTLTFSGTRFDMNGEDEAAAVHPLTVVELRGHYQPDTYAMAPANTGANVKMVNVWNRCDSPLTQALVINSHDVGDSTNLSSFKLLQSKLYLGDGAVVHGSRWKDPDERHQTEGADPTVLIDQAWFVPPPADEDAAICSDVSQPKVGMLLEDSGTPTTTRPVNLPFLATDGLLEVQDSRFSQLATQDIPLMVAPVLVLNRSMVDTLEDVGPSSENHTGLALASDLLVKSSLMCDIRGTDAVFGAIHQTYAEDTPLSLYVLNSALWQLDQSLFQMSISDQYQPDHHDNASAMVAANVTLHRTQAAAATGSTPVVMPHGSGFVPEMRLYNTYLQGAWSIAHPADQLTSAAVVMHDAARATPCNERADVACTNAMSPHLSEDFAEETNCSQAMQVWAQKLLNEPISDGSYGDRYLLSPEDDLSTLSPADFDDDQRPALILITEPSSDERRVWGYPETNQYGTWEFTDSDRCASDNPTEIGAWSTATANHCSLPFLEPYGTDASEDSEETTAPTDPMEPEDTGATQASLDSSDPSARLDPDAPDGLSLGSDSMHGLASDCRYSAASVWFLLPLALRRRRRSDAA